MSIPIITKKEAEVIAGSKDGKIEVSLDLGLSKTAVEIKGRLVYADGQIIPIAEFDKLKENFCYFLEDNHVKKLAFFSGETNFYYKLLPTKDWPTFTLSSTPMHRAAQISPKQDVESKIKTIMPISGNVLDTCCGLGYTAILSSKNAARVYTFEKDKNVLVLARLNPYSRELFSNKKIKLHEQSIFDAIADFGDSYFDRIIHDPPTFKYSPELYSKKFYLQLSRVLKKGGILYHYAPWCHKTKGAVFYPRIIRDLKAVGFKNAVYHEKSSGVIGRK